MVQQFETDMRRFLDEVSEFAPPELRDILFESTQSSFARAVAADLLDIVPVVGDVSNFFRVRHAEKIGTVQSRKFALQLIDLAAGALPDTPQFPIGAILDALTPTNTVTYLRERQLLP